VTSGRYGDYFADEDDAKAYARSINLAVTGMTGLKAWEGVETPQPSEPDPIYALIEKHRRLFNAYSVAIDVADQRRDKESEDAMYAACDANCQAERDLVEVGATTSQGWASPLRHEDQQRRA
jgi:hypothetical protein